MGRRSKSRGSKTGRIRKLGNIARIPSGKVKPEVKGSYDMDKFHKIRRRVEAKMARREERKRYLEERARKSGEIREQNHSKAVGERAKVRAEREAASRRR